MTDRLYLSYWLRGYTEHNMLRHFSAALGKFPFSRLKPGMLLKVYAIEHIEPPLIERTFLDSTQLDELLEAARETRHADCAYEVESAWDLWQYLDGDWRLAPAPVTLACYGPAFDREREETLRIDFGPDIHFLPQPDVAAGSARMLESNIRALLHLVHDLDTTLAALERTLWSESGDNFAERLQTSLQSRLGN